VNPKAGAVQFAGNGSETGLTIQNNTDFSTSAFSFSSNRSASPALTGNQVLPPSALPRRWSPRVADAPFPDAEGADDDHLSLLDVAAGHGTQLKRAVSILLEQLKEHL